MKNIVVVSPKTKKFKVNNPQAKQTVKKVFAGHCCFNKLLCFFELCKIIRTVTFLMNAAKFDDKACHKQAQNISVEVIRFIQCSDKLLAKSINSFFLMFYVLKIIEEKNLVIWLQSN